MTTNTARKFEKKTTKKTTTEAARNKVLRMKRKHGFSG